MERWQTVFKIEASEGCAAFRIDCSDTVNLLENDPGLEPRPSFPFDRHSEFSVRLQGSSKLVELGTKVLGLFLRPFPYLFEDVMEFRVRGAFSFLKLQKSVSCPRFQVLVWSPRGGTVREG